MQVGTVWRRARCGITPVADGALPWIMEACRQGPCGSRRWISFDPVESDRSHHGHPGLRAVCSVEIYQTPVVGTGNHHKYQHLWGRGDTVPRSPGRAGLGIRRVGAAPAIVTVVRRKRRRRVHSKRPPGIKRIRTGDSRKGNTSHEPRACYCEDDRQSTGHRGNGPGRHAYRPDAPRDGSPWFNFAAEDRPTVSRSVPARIRRDGQRAACRRCGEPLLICRRG